MPINSLENDICIWLVVDMQSRSCVIFDLNRGNSGIRTCAAIAHIAQGEDAICIIRKAAAGIKADIEGILPRPRPLNPPIKCELDDIIIAHIPLAGI